MDEVLTFWFEELEPKHWWIKDADLDDMVRSRFADLLVSASQCELFHWRVDLRGRLAEIIVLDQFSRNIYRDTVRAFSQDPLALALAQEAVELGTLENLTETERSFLLMPYMHSESVAIHREAERLFKQWAAPSNYQFEIKHKVIIDRFGRYPHRNIILGRESTEEEQEFLRQPGSSF